MRSHSGGKRNPLTVPINLLHHIITNLHYQENVQNNYLNTLYQIELSLTFISIRLSSGVDAAAMEQPRFSIFIYLFLDGKVTRCVIGNISQVDKPSPNVSGNIQSCQLSFILLWDRFSVHAGFVSVFTRSIYVCVGFFSIQISCKMKANKTTITKYRIFSASN